MVDCRKCRYFISVKELDEMAKHNAYVWIEKFRPGSELLGLCGRFNRPVTYYIGYCRYFVPKEIRIRRLTEFLKI